ncbi:MAG: nucleotide-binding protein [Chloroflexota bacterium]|nr:nucleotide-binding protein [Chloroflexota bacterium]
MVEEIQRRAGEPDVTAAEKSSAAAREQYTVARGEVDSILTAYLGERQDELIDRLRTDAEGIVVASAQQYIRATFPSGQIMTRDSLAMSQGFIGAPHLTVQAQVLALKAPFEGCALLADIADRAAAHMNRVGAARRATASAQGRAIFIGHGRSLLWRELKDFIQDRLALPWEEFNRVPVAGVTNIARLAQMLDAAGIAFVVLTAEDELADGQVAARQNVVHEAGLFQGRLGFTRAIVLLEEGCSEFSNIQGLGQIRFPAANIGAAFEDVRRVLEREGFLDT